MLPPPLSLTSHSKGKASEKLKKWNEMKFSTAKKKKKKQKKKKHKTENEKQKTTKNPHKWNRVTCSPYLQSALKCQSCQPVCWRYCCSFECSAAADTVMFQEVETALHYQYCLFLANCCVCLACFILLSF